MPVIEFFKRLLTVDDSTMQETFSLGDRPAQPTPGATPEPGRKRRRRRRAHGRPAEGEPRAGEPLATSLAANRRRLETVFNIPPNADVVIRPFDIGTRPPLKAMAVFMEGLAKRDVINDAVLTSLMQFAHLDPMPPDRTRLMEDIALRWLPGNEVRVLGELPAVVKEIVLGATAVLVEGSDRALIVETKGWDYRSVEEPQSEMLVRGPHEGFVENFRTNTGLIRKILRTERLVTEMTTVGRIGRSLLAIMYVDGLANPKLIEEVRRRIQAIEVDYVAESGILEQLIEDYPLAFMPSVLATQRPDRVAAFLSEGHVAILLDNSPFALVVPTTFFTLLHSPEDHYLRWPYGAFMRVIRVGAFFIAILLPALYVAVSNYHQEMIPTDLMLSMAGARELVPFPTVVEVLLMEGAFELIREAGLRVPTVIGPTIGIVGALILGQAAVQAGIISPLLVIVVALTALGSFGIPDYGLQFGVRLSRFLFILAGAVLGFLGISAGLVLLALHLTSLKSFGVPVASPRAPYRRSQDVILRGWVYRDEKRPEHLRTLESTRQSELTRPWWPHARVHWRRKGRR
ncbi:MAG: spore germination protein [Bacillota bacterium]